MTKSPADRGLYPHRLADGKTVVWYVRIMVAGRRRHFGSFRTVTEARHFRDRIQTDARVGRYYPGQPDSDMTVEALCQAYLPLVADRRVGLEHRRFSVWWQQQLGHRRVLSLTSQDLEEAKACLRRGRGPGTVNHYLKFLRHVMRLLVRPRAFVLDLWAEVALLTAHPPQPVIATPEEERRLYRALGPEATIAQLARVLGLRRGQLFTLRWERLTWEPATYRLASFKAQRERMLPLPRPAVVMLRQWWQRAGAPREGWMIPDPKDPTKPRDANAWYKSRFVPALKRAGLYTRGLRFHSLRHTWATRGLEAGTHLRTLQQMGGWSDVRLVERYTHLVDPILREGMERAAGSDWQTSARSEPAPNASSHRTH